MAFQRMIIRPIPTHNCQKPTPSHPDSSGSSQTPTVLYFHTRPLPAWTRQRQSHGPTCHRGPLRLMAFVDREDEVSMRAERLTGLLERQTAPPPTKWSLYASLPLLLVQFTKVVGGIASNPTAMPQVTKERRKLGMQMFLPLWLLNVSPTSVVRMRWGRPSQCCSFWAGALLVHTTHPGPQLARGRLHSPLCSAKRDLAFVSQLKYGPIVSVQKNWSFSSFQVFFPPKFCFKPGA